MERSGEATGKELIFQFLQQLYLQYPHKLKAPDWSHSLDSVFVWNSVSEGERERNWLVKRKEMLKYD